MARDDAAVMQRRRNIGSAGRQRAFSLEPQQGAEQYPKQNDGCRNNTRGRTARRRGDPPRSEEDEWRKEQKEFDKTEHRTDINPSCPMRGRGLSHRESSQLVYRGEGDRVGRSWSCSDPITLTRR